MDDYRDMDAHTLKQWQRLGRKILNALDDWSTGTISRAVYITEKEEAEIRKLLEFTDD